MSATVSAWGKPGAWALDSEENESELLQGHKEDSSVANGSSNGDEKPDFPSLAAAATSKTKKKKPQALSLSEFSAYKPAAASAQPKGLTTDELMRLPTGPRERSAEELDRNKLGGGFRSYGGGGRDEQPRRQGGFSRDSDREFTPSRADETDDWGAGKKQSVSSGFDRRERGERGERGGFFGDSQSRADDVDNWSSNKSFVPSEPRRYEKRGGFGLESSDGGADSGNWGKRKEEEGRKSGGAFDSLRDRRGGFDSNSVDSESWGKKREEVSGGGGGGRPKLNLQPRTVTVGEGEKSEIGGVDKPKGSSPFGDARPREEVLKEKGQDMKEFEEKLETTHTVSEGGKSVITSVDKPKGSNPFGDARPREEVLKEKGQDWKEIDEKVNNVKIKDVVSPGPIDGQDVGKRNVWSGSVKERLRLEEKTESPWRRPGLVDSSPKSGGGEIENGTAEKTEDGNAEE